MGAQVEREDRMLAIQRVIPSSLVNNETNSHVEYVGEILDATYDAVEGTKKAVFLWGKVGLLTGGPLFSLSVWLLLWVAQVVDILWPYFEIGAGFAGDVLVWAQPYLLVLLDYGIRLCQVMWQKFLEQDSWNIFLEVMTPVALLLLWMLKNHIVKRKYVEKLQNFYHTVKQNVRRKYRDLMASVRKRSLIVASFIPHLLLFIPIGGVIYFLPELLAAISRGYVLLLVSMLYPISNSIYAIQSADPEMQKKAITYWIVFTVPAFISGFIEYIPFGAKLVAMLPYSQEIFFVFCLWMQLPWTDGSYIMYSIIVPIVNKLVAIIPLPGFLKSVPGQDKESQKFMFFNLVSAFLPEQYKDKASSILFHSGHLLFGFMFFFTPNYFTGIGCLLMGLAVPYYSSITALVSSTSNKNDKSFLEWWVKYWIVFYSFSTLHDGLTAALTLEHFPFWYHIKLGIIMWLQLPIFRGANVIYSLVFLPPYRAVSQAFSTASTSSLKNFMSPNFFGTPRTAQTLSRIPVEDRTNDCESEIRSEAQNDSESENESKRRSEESERLGKEKASSTSEESEEERGVKARRRLNFDKVLQKEGEKNADNGKEKAEEDKKTK